MSDGLSPRNLASVCSSRRTNGSQAGRKMGGAEGVTKGPRDHSL